MTTPLNARIARTRPNPLFGTLVVTQAAEQPPRYTPTGQPWRLRSLLQLALGRKLFA
ncbi:MAG: hypothetical protein ACK6C0_04705 [Betaproteobacteria bacterium]|jgi:hypothetical protein